MAFPRTAGCLEVNPSPRRAADSGRNQSFELGKRTEKMSESLEGESNIIYLIRFSG